MTEFNMDTGNFYTQQAYDISNIQVGWMFIAIMVLQLADIVML